ncbi:MAG: HAMP domain-containing histidine kinase [Lachnospiraceae bacterium]|jgi:signal transduction histidine kinase|nr:HAMP domain-containing histidine kinase [Lachnospiraceae bacterium]
MAVLLAAVCSLLAWLAMRHVRLILAIRSLNGQLGELERGSRMELGLESRQRDFLEFGRTLNRFCRHQFQKQLQYERAEKRLKENVTCLAHDIRTPLTGAAGYVQLAGECGEEERRQRYLRTAGDRLEELKDMLEELFLYTKLAGGEFEPVPTEFQVLPLLSDCLLGLYCQFEKRGISPEVVFESEGVKVLADEEWLRRIFRNLLQNALFHGDGAVRITQKGASLIFENALADREKPDPGQLFERFYKADPARRKGSSGLGLFIVKELAERMGWSVRAEVGGERLGIILTMQKV